MPPAERANTVGYVLRRFPVLSETFILNEILALEAQGLAVHIFSLAPPRDPRFHEDLAKLKASISYLPGIFDLKMLLRYNVKAAKRCRQRYLRALLYVAGTGKPSLVWRFLQAGYVAEKARRLHLRQLHAHFATRATSVAFLASMISQIPYSFTAHAFDIYKTNVVAKVLEKKIKDAKFVVTVSEANKTYLENIANGSDDKIFLVHNGIDLSRFVPNGEVPEPPFTLLSVGRLTEKKGQAVLIEACRELRDRGVPFRCWIIGKGRLRPQLEGLIERWKLPERVQILGSYTQRKILRRYQAAHLFVLPCIIASDGNREGLPVSIVEALACGLPVVTTPVTGIPEVVSHRRNGLLTPCNDAQALADAIQSLIEDATLYERLRANARTSVVSTFDVRQTGAALRGLFDGRGL